MAISVRPVLPLGSPEAVCKVHVTPLSVDRYTPLLVPAHHVSRVDGFCAISWTCVSASRFVQVAPPSVVVNSPPVAWLPELHPRTRPPTTRWVESLGSTTTLAKFDRSSSVDAPVPLRVSQVSPPSAL